MEEIIPLIEECLINIYRKVTFSIYVFLKCIENIVFFLTNYNVKRKQSLATKGKPGKPITGKAKIKMREAKLKNPTRYWLGKKFPKEATLRGLITKKERGYVVSEETKLKKSRTATFINLQGAEIIITNFSQFCRENKLDLSRFCEVARGKIRQHRGYTLKQPS